MHTPGRTELTQTKNRPTRSSSSSSAAVITKTVAQSSATPAYLARSRVHEAPAHVYLIKSRFVIPVTDKGAEHEGHEFAGQEIAGHKSAGGYETIAHSEAANV